MSETLAALETATVDRLLARRLALQQYITALTEQLRADLAPVDEQLLDQLNRFALSADAATLAAFAHYRRHNARANALRRVINEAIATQQAQTLNSFEQALREFIAAEMQAQAQILAVEPLSTRGLATEPVAGRLVGAVIAGVFAAYSTRLIAELAIRARTAPTTMGQVLIGTAGQRGRDALLRWRDQRHLRPEVDQIINGAATATGLRLYRHHQVKQVHWLSTLDYRACVSCVAAEQNSPHDIERVPRYPMHPLCRCLIIPAEPGVKTRRPFVKSDQPVSQIPKKQRAGRIGTTDQSITGFFNRMSDADRVRYMGSARATLWREGKITDIKDLVDQISYEPLPLEALPA